MFLWFTVYRRGWTRNAEILSVWRHRERGFTHGNNWRRLDYLSIESIPCSCLTGGLSMHN